VSGRTLYHMLMLDPSVDTEIITLVYRQLAKRHHPDRDSRSDAGARMAELNAAYATLSDPVKRAQYDRSLRRTDSLVDVAPRHYDAPSTSGVRMVAVPVAAPTDRSEHGEAGPPPSFPPPSGRVITYGRYRGWSLSQVAHHDRDYLEWLQRTPSGRAYRAELDAVLSSGS